MKGTPSPPALRMNVQLRQEQHALPLLPVQAGAAGRMAEEWRLGGCTEGAGEHRAAGRLAASHAHPRAS